MTAEDQTISSSGGYVQSSSATDHVDHHHHEHGESLNPPLVKKKRNLPGNPGNNYLLKFDRDH